jgi:putative flavoprotein involved in K+ transport
MRTTTVIVGAGHAGLAMSRRLTERSLDHVVLERGEVANSWRTERWPSLRLLTPNWQTQLPGYAYQGHDPDGFMAAGDVAELVTTYSSTIDAPVHTHTPVRSIQAHRGGYEVRADNGTWLAATVVLASGACNRPSVPPMASALTTDVMSITPMDYRGPDALPGGGVLVVGAAATAVQLADEIHRSGRPVTLSVGEHVRMPRTYRGRDIFWWMDAAGVLDERYDEVDDLHRARHLPSPQLIGTPQRATLDLNALRARGVRIVGRLGRIADGVAQFAGSLANVCALADLKMNRLLTRLDEWAATTGIDDHLDRPERFDPTRVDAHPLLELALSSDDIRTIVWATGYRADYTWLDVPVLDRHGRIRHDGGVVTDAPGMYVLGMPLLRRRRSTYINGAEADTDDLARNVHSFLSDRSPRTSLTRPDAALWSS